MNSIKIHIKDNHAKIAVNGVEISEVTAYEIKQDSEHWGAHVRLEFFADGDVDLDINPKSLPQ